MNRPKPEPGLLPERLPSPLRLFLIILVTLCAVSVLDAAIGFARFGRFGLLYLWPPNPAFDFLDYTPQFPHLHTPQFFGVYAYPWYYPAPAIFVLYPFYKIAASTSRVIGYGVFAITVLGLDVVVLRRFQTALVRRGLSLGNARLLLWSTLLLGWPIYFGLQRGNIESLLWIAVAAAIACYARQRYGWAAVLLGVAGSAKLYPLLYLVLFLRPRRYLEILLGLGAAAVITLAGLRFLVPNVGYAWRETALGVHNWTLVNLISDDALGFDHSLFGTFRQCVRGLGMDVPHALRIYYGLAGMVAAGLFLLRVLRLPRANQVLFLACATLLLPSTSYDYTMVGMLIPWGWLVLLCLEHARAGEPMRLWTVLFTLFAITLSPLSMFHVQDGTFFYFQGSVRAAALLSLMIFAVVKPMHEAPTHSLAR